MTRTTKVHRVTLLVIDHDDVGADGVRSVLKSTRYPNHCISPDVKHVETREVEWSDEHPLNYRATEDEAYRALFATDAPRAQGNARRDFVQVAEHVIEHDPDDGCPGCPLHERSSIDTPWCMAEHDEGDDDSAPTWCPLRTGPVTVRRPEGA